MRAIRLECPIFNRCSPVCRTGWQMTFARRDIATRLGNCATPYDRRCLTCVTFSRHRGDNLRPVIFLIYDTQGATDRWSLNRISGCVQIRRQGYCAFPPFAYDNDLRRWRNRAKLRRRRRCVVTKVMANRKRVQSARLIRDLLYPVRAQTDNRVCGKRRQLQAVVFRFRAICPECARPAVDAGHRLFRSAMGDGKRQRRAGLCAAPRRSRGEILRPVDDCDRDPLRPVSRVYPLPDEERNALLSCRSRRHPGNIGSVGTKRRDDR
jgi:hypothetical protein